MRHGAPLADGAPDLKGKRALFSRLGAAGVGLVLALLVAEAVLRAIGFSFELYPREVAFGWPTPQILRRHYRPDPDLFWVTRGYHRKLEAARARRPDIVLMGCSVTELSDWGGRLAKLVAREDGSPRILNLGVAGWSSYQGLRQLRRDVAPLRPRIALILYGWNDHWIGFGIEDKHVHRINSVAYGLLRRSRLAQLVSRAWTELERTGRSGPLRRVSIEDFEANLEEMVEVARSAGIEPVLLTAPTSHRRGHEPVYLRRRWLEDLSELVPLHRRYAAAVRSAAAANGAMLCDLASRFDELATDERIDTWFGKDGIHPNAEGSRRIAEIVADCLIRGGLVADARGAATGSDEAQASQRDLK